jgi:hypothetical protein
VDVSQGFNACLVVMFVRRRLSGFGNGGKDDEAVRLCDARMCHMCNLELDTFPSLFNVSIVRLASPMEG